MKTVFIKKDSFENNSFRVSYFEKDAVQEFKVYKTNPQTYKIEEEVNKETYNKLLFCHRLEFTNNANELDSYIEEMRQYWENRINS